MLATQPSLGFIWLEITGRCNLECTHCYADSGPHRDHGTMTTADWLEVISEAADLGVADVQFIGGEPTLHPDLVELMDHASGLGLGIEVFSNLTRVPARLWEAFERCSVRLATSFYSMDAAAHDAVTQRRSQHRTLANIEEAVRRGIPLRVGLIRVRDDQDVEATAAHLREIGVEHVGFDDLRGVGRGAGDQPGDASQLCGQCAGQVAAVMADGTVRPCVFSRWLDIGDVRAEGLQGVAAGSRRREVREELASAFAGRETAQCDPWVQCNPKLNPGPCSPETCIPCVPHQTCFPCIPNCTPHNRP